MNTKLTEVALPWYRQTWPWILMAGPAVVIVAAIFTAYLAVVSNDGLVDDDYYKQGLAINQDTARDEAAVRKGLTAELMQNTETRQIRILLRSRPGVGLPALLKARITHPTKAGVDQHVVLRAVESGVYSGELSMPLAGRWRIVVEDDKREWRLSGEWNVEKAASVRLPDSAQ